jgi:hypothetical protein
MAITKLRAAFGFASSAAALAVSFPGCRYAAAGPNEPGVKQKEIREVLSRIDRIEAETLARATAGSGDGTALFQGRTDVS